MSIFLTLTSAGAPTGPDYEDFVNFVQTVRPYLDEVHNRPTRELRPPVTGDEVFRPSDDPRPRCVEWRTLWTAARNGIDFFLRTYHRRPSQSDSIDKTDFDVAHYPLRAWANHVLNEKLWFLRYELPGPENERDLLDEFMPWEQRKEIYRQDRDLPELKS